MIDELEIHLMNPDKVGKYIVTGHSQQGMEQVQNERNGQNTQLK